ncbi:MAG TPA: hypothetical protein VNE67_10375 [Acetobacteraceae bacterium]|nr:hypothetical protein [Acetobacteraceae bacterium]
MNQTAAPMLDELPEDRASGAIAVIYEEIRRFSGVPYVSSMQRYLATTPGLLEFTWGALRPAMAAGAIQRAGWGLVGATSLAPLPPIPPALLAAWGIDAAGRAGIRNVAANFVRVAPVNLVFGRCLGLLLDGARPAGAGFAPGWTPPALLPPMPGNVDPAALADDARAHLLRFATELDGKPFIPALYRQLAHWPGLLGWLADQVVPRLGAPEMRASGTAMRDAAAAAAPAIVALLPGLPPGPAPDAPTAARVAAAIARYGVTSPELTMVGQLLLDALPG